MQDRKNPERVQTGRLGGLTGWANMDARGQRHQRMAEVRDKSPASDNYWVLKVGFDPDALTKDHRSQIATAKKQHFAAMRINSHRTKKLAKAERMRKAAARRDVRPSPDRVVKRSHS
ncbi:hypothetical protein [Mycobacterium numidiamassiliense]|uniref:hypothetical protein n=1 Tax=Mycobacterium numidiamassiliense TaxID=1841861 RepID=UPI0013F60812|nr:hypothetical protein [Mycobacterium numidiamassiliense]